MLVREKVKKKAKSKKKIDSQLPGSITVLGKRIQVIREPMKPGEFGEYHQFIRLIKVNDKLTDQDAADTLFHEAIHAALHISGLTQMLPASDNTDIEEAIVVMLENAFSHIVDIKKLASDIQFEE